MKTTQVAAGGILAVSAIGASSQATSLAEDLCRLGAYYSLPASRQSPGEYQRFLRLSRRWREDTQWLSSSTQIAMHPAYQAIIGMGDDALRWILADLRRTSAPWFWALKAISAEDPVPPSDRGVVCKMTEAWLEWGMQKGLLARELG